MTLNLYTYINIPLGSFPNLMVDKSENYKKMFELEKNKDSGYNYNINISSLKKADEIEDALHKFDTFDVIIIDNCYIRTWL